MTINRFKIEKNIPIPAPTRQARKSKYPWDDMDIGDSFAVDEPSDTAFRKLYSTVFTRMRKHPGKKYKVGIDETNRARVWRVQ